MRVPLKGQAGDVSGRLSQSVVDPSPFSSPYGDFNSLLLCTLLQLLIRDHFSPPHSQDVPESAVGKGLKLVMIFFVNFKVSDQYRRTDFTLELKILIFVHSEMTFDLHMGRKMENATCLPAPGLNIFLGAAGGGDKAAEVCEG